jgi:hypothetical protein
VKLNKHALVLSFVVLAQGMTGMAWGQMTNTDDITLPTTKEQGNGALTPYFWVGAQVAASAGYNLERNTFGFKTDTDNTWASFNVALVDSRYDTPKSYEVGNDPDVWSGHVALKNYTMKLNSWQDKIEEENVPNYIAEIQGKGFHIGFLGQAGEYVQNTGNASLTSGGTVLYFADPDAQDTDYYTDSNPKTTTTYSGTTIMYTGYAKDDLCKVYISGISEGNVDTTTTSKGDGMAGALNAVVAPLGAESTDVNPFTVKITANALAGANFTANPIGFGVKVEPSVYLAPNTTITPIAAFDATIPENGDMVWAAGGGALLCLSGKRWVTDDWDEIDMSVDYFNKFYEFDKILKYAYVQAYATYSKADDLDLAFKFEEPDGVPGFDPNLGAMAEFRLNNLMQSTTAKMGWSGVARASYGFENNTIVPNLRAYLNSEAVLKFRAGCQFGIIPHAGFEFAYTSRNLNAESKATGTSKPDLGRIELLVIIKTDSGTIQTIKRMNSWNY